MKKTVRKVMALGLTVTSVMGLVACGTKTASTETGSKVITKPEKFKVMVDGTLVTEANGGQAFYDYYAKLTGLEIEWVRPDHSGYYDAVGNAFNSDDSIPDAVLLSSDYYALYASSGFLWNMTDAWNNSATKNSGRLISTAENVLKSLIVNGPDGNKAMYGYAPSRGNGCCTYIKEAWLKKAGYSRNDVDGKTLTFKEYYAILKKMHEVTGKSVISSAGYIGTEAPYTNYLPEFYQQANYTFYQDSSGNYTDGFSAPAMKEALARIATGVSDGIIDKESITNTTANARDKFYADLSGVFSYWAGTWADTLTNQLAAKGLDSSLIALNPIKELGTYVERISPAWCITTHAENPDGIFKYFIDTMLDGNETQMAWIYGAKGTHWDTKAETVTLKGKESEGLTYAEGQFHMLPSPEKPSNMMTKNHIDTLLAIASFSGKDPGDSLVPKIARENMDFFAKNSTVAVPVPMTEELSDNIGDINKQRNVIIAAVANGAMTVDQGMTEYQKKVGSLVEEVLKSLNKK